MAKKPKKPKDPPKRKKQTAAKAKRQQRKQQSKAARKQQRQKQQQYRQSAKAKKQTSFSSRVSGLFDSFSGSGIGQSALFADKPKPKKKVSNPILEIQKEIKKEKEKAERAKKVKLGKDTRKLDEQQYKKQRLSNIKTKANGRMNDLVNKTNELSSELDRILSNLPPSLARLLAPSKEIGKHFEIDDFYAHSYEDEMVKNATDTLIGMVNAAQDVLDGLIRLQASYGEYREQLSDAFDEIDSLIAKVRQSGVMGNAFTSPEQIASYYQTLSEQQMQAAKDLGLDVD